MVTSPRRTEEIQTPQPHSPLWICQHPQSKSHFSARRSVLSALDLNAPLCRFLTQTTPPPRPPFTSPSTPASVSLASVPFLRGPPPATHCTQGPCFSGVFSVTLFLFSHLLFLGHKGGSPVAVPPSSIAGFIIHSRSGPFLEDDSSIPASPWLTLTSGGGTPSSTPISQPLKSSPTTQASILPCPQPPLGLGHHL